MFGDVSQDVKMGIYYPFWPFVTKDWKRRNPVEGAILGGFKGLTMWLKS